MQDLSLHTSAAALRLVCHDVVRALIGKYGWILLPEHEIVELALGAITDDPPPDLEPIVVRQYTIALYDACRQEHDADWRERGYADLFRYLYRVSFNRWRESAEDVAQRGLALVCEHIERCQSPSTFLAFALCELRYAAQLEQRARGQELLLETAQPRETEPTPPSDSPLLEREQLQVLLDAVRRLPDRRKRAVVMLRFFSELSDEEIGNRLGLTSGHVRVLRFNALKRLRKDQHLRDYFER
jgi:RNA polymerase sigma factor (sigma-70 family)